MKAALRKLQINDVVSAQIVEAVAPGEFVVSFEGDLLRVKNSSGQNFNAGSYVLLRVTAIAPLQFQLSRAGNGNFEWHA